MIVRSSMLLRLLLAAGLLLSLGRSARANDDFVGEGVVLSDPSGSWDAAHALVVDGNDLFVVGQDTVVCNGEWRIERRSAADGGVASTSARAAW